MAVFYVIFDRREQNGKQVEGQKFENVTLLPEKKSSAGLGGTTGQLEDACVLKVETANTLGPGIEEAQRAVRHFYPGLQSSTPVCVTEAAFKEI